MKSCAHIVLVLCSVGMSASWMAQAQSLVVTSSGPADEILNYYRPQIEAAPDGSFAVAWEALIQGEFFTRWHIGVQRYSPTGNPVGATHYFKPEYGCFALDTWLSDHQSNVELAFGSTGLLTVLMQHSGEYDLITTSEWSSEITLGVIDQNGMPADLNPTHANCEQWKFIFPGADEQDRPRMALTPTNNLILVTDGFFGQSDFRNVGLDIYDNNLNDLINGELIPHEDPSSQIAFHAFPDVATNGDLVVAVWNRCPLIDSQGNADECDIGAQFATLTPGGLQAVGTNVVVNAGDPVGTLNMRPSVAMNPGGTSVVVWEDFRMGAMGEIFGQRFDASGQAVGSNFQISEGGGQVEVRPEIRPEVAMLNDGQFMVVWADTSGAGYQARGRQYAANGTPLSPPFLLDDTPGIETGVPNVGTDGSNYYYVTLGRMSGGSLSVLATTPASNIANEPDASANASLSLNAYPNPFRNQATFEYNLERLSEIRVGLYDALGRQVATLVDGLQRPGRHAVNIEGHGLAPGLYVIRVQSPHGEDAHVMVRQ